MRNHEIRKYCDNVMSAVTEGWSILYQNECMVSAFRFTVKCNTMIVYVETVNK